MQQKNKINGFAQIFNLNFAALGLQVAWSLMLANIAGIYTFFGVNGNRLSYFWIIPSFIGLLLPPIIGYFSDRTNTSFGKRLPYIFFGDLMTGISLVLMLYARNYIEIAVLQCLFIASMNIALHPGRVIIADVVPAELYTKFFAFQIVFSGFGSIFASALPWLLLKTVGVHKSISSIPFEIKVSFIFGACIIILGAFWTTFTVKKYLPIRENTEFIHNTSYNIKKFFTLIKNSTFLQISLMQVLTWFSTLCFFVYLTPLIEQTLFSLSISTNTLHDVYYKQVVEKSTVLTGLCYVVYMSANIVFAFLIPKLNKIFARKYVHASAMLIGGLAFFAFQLVHSTVFLMVTMIGFGVACASFNVIPIAIFSSIVPHEELGVAMGVFNIAICLPQIFLGIFGGLILISIFDNNVINMMTLAGVLYVLAGLVSVFLPDKFSIVR